jgi:uncharacterized membrane protein YecN with MAPEG domain
MHRLQAVAHIGQRAVHDGRQRIGQIALLERLFQVDALNVIAAAGRYQAFSHGAGLEEALIRGKRCRHRRHQEEISVRLSISTRPVRRHDGAIDRKHLNIDQRQGKTPMMHLTGLYCVPLALMMMGLSAHVSILRGKTAISILDGGNITLAERIRRHGNFAENVPIALLLMAFAEASGTAALWTHAAGVSLLAGRLLHPLGLFHDRPVTAARIAGGSLTWLSMLISMVNIVLDQWGA